MNVSQTPSCMIFTVEAANRSVCARSRSSRSSSIWSSPRSRSHQSAPTTRAVRSPLPAGAKVGGVVVHPEVGGHDRVLPGRDPEGVQVSLTLEQSLVHLVGRRFRCETADELCGALVERAARLAVVVALDPAVGGIGRGRRHPAPSPALGCSPTCYGRRGSAGTRCGRAPPHRGGPWSGSHRGTRPWTSRRPGSIRGPDAPRRTSSREAGSPRVEWSSWRSHCNRSTPPPTGWTCASWNPGRSIRPARSKTSVLGPTCSRIASSLPTATIRPSLTATACSRVRAASTV